MNNNYFLFLLLILTACGGKTKERDIASLRPNYSNYNWSGVYEFKDGENIHTLKLLRSRVDADYQAMYSTTSNAFGGSIWKVNDFNDSVQLVFINNFTENAVNVPYKRGDLILSLKRDSQGNINTVWHTSQPDSSGNFTLIDAGQQPN